MKKATSILMLGIAVAVVASMTPLKWKTTSIDLGQVSKDEVAELTFEFTNNSNEDIRILEAKGSCGCTKIAYPETAIKAGESASISANFKSAKLGAFKKNIRIKTSNSEEYTYLHFKGEVVE
ncbi:DUF1573 domain-containing protein [Ekhidna sp.]|uniref:DUF1573 domain-containing protein n=1 Tax=Ekhidna sp. TaxID=2608089 RepID=UPI003CCC067B